MRIEKNLLLREYRTLGVLDAVLFFYVRTSDNK